MKIGLLGGTFNPIHMGHLVLAQECWFRLSLDKVIFIPAFLPPHKEVVSDISVADRLNMVRIALEGDKRFEISTYEIDKGGTSYSVDTIDHFIGVYGEQAELFFITGADSIDTLAEWKDVEKILEAVTFVVATRPGWKDKGPFEDNMLRVDIPALEVSSSMVRERVENRQPIDHIVPPKVVKYIRNKGLYRD
ncbi:MAG: nicotinate-nucleotide adenylyltransferase [Candidatus Tantalella remota]|nr:nicotinate-nucleotide adenylyltransferase [Candidatus Tantalella remota]